MLFHVVATHDPPSVKVRKYYSLCSTQVQFVKLAKFMDIFSSIFVCKYQCLVQKLQRESEIILLYVRILLVFFFKKIKFIVFTINSKQILFVEQTFSQMRFFLCDGGCIYFFILFYLYHRREKNSSQGPLESGTSECLKFEFCFI